MLHKIKALVLHSIKYQDNSPIVYLYTNQFGRQSFIVKGVWSGKSKNKANLFQPLFLLDIEAVIKQGKGLQTLRECKLDYPFSSIHTDVYKSTLALFISELLYKVIKEEEVNKGLFDFLYHSVCMLDEMKEGVANFHLHFMVQLSKYLGFLPPPADEPADYFDIKSADYVLIKPLHPQYFDQSSTFLLNRLQQYSASQLGELSLSRHDRYTFLNDMINFYSFHLDLPLLVNSLGILHEVFSE